MAVPETTVHENYKLMFSHDDIRFARQIDPIEPKPVTKAVDHTPQRHLRYSIGRMDARHYGASFFARKHVSHSSSQSKLQRHRHLRRFDQLPRRLLEIFQLLGCKNAPTISVLILGVADLPILNPTKECRPAHVGLFEGFADSEHCATSAMSRTDTS
jgi:hypothetical protein